VALAPQRDLFEIPSHVAYLNCAYMAPSLRAVREAGEAGVGRKSRPWEVAPADFFIESEEARRLVAELVGGDAEGVAIVPSASYGIGVAAANVALGPGQSVVLLAEQFPSNVYPWREAASAAGAEIVTVPRPQGEDWTRGVLAAVDERTAIVAVPHCHWTDGTLVDLAAVARAAAEVGAALVVDATQSLGALPLDVGSARPDFLVAATYKWLLGPYSLGFLWAAESRRDGVPLEHNWITRGGSEDFAGLVDYRDGFQPGARRYDMGERSNFALLPMALAALRQILAWGVGEIADTVTGHTARIEKETAALGLVPVEESHRAGHMLGVEVPGGVPETLVADLAAADVHVSVRGSSVRVSPHVWTTAEDIDRFLEVLEAAVGPRRTTRRTAPPVP
jgi:selenocysteine lyase/cysteine desulfurase